MEYMLYAFWAAIVSGWIVYVGIIKKNRNLRAAESGEDLELVRRAVGFTGGAKGERLVYAHWIESESYGRTVRTTYTRFAVAFEGEALRIFPLRIDRKTREVEARSPLTLTAENLGKVMATVKEKDGVTKRVETWLGDKQGHAILKLYVDAKNLRKNRFFPVNICQQEECEAFRRYIDALSRQVAEENPHVDEMLAKETVQGLGTLGFALSLGGALGGMCFPPMGALLCLAGLILAIISKCKGAAGKRNLIGSVICMAWILGFFWFYGAYIW